MAEVNAQFPKFGLNAATSDYPTPEFHQMWPHQCTASGLKVFRGLGPDVYVYGILCLLLLQPVIDLSYYMRDKDIDSILDSYSD